MDLKTRQRHRFYSVDLKEIYHMSVIDYLQVWNMNKKGERFLKTKLLGKKGDELSAIEPNIYKDRFVQVVVKKMITAAWSERFPELAEETDFGLESRKSAKFPREQ